MVRISMNNPSNAENRKTLILGLGNDILSDDAIGLLVVRRLAELLKDHPDLDFEESSEMGLALLDFMEGRAKVVLIDSIQTGEVNPGTVREVELTDVARLVSATPHFLGVSETLALGAELGLSMPEKVRIFTIEAADPFTIANHLTPALKAALPQIVTQIAAALVQESLPSCVAIEQELAKRTLGSVRNHPL
jgi:hydrogenase maturation protease